MITDYLIEKRRPARVLLVEDNPGDVILTRRAFAEAKIANDMRVASTGEEALSMLRREGANQGDALPDLILLDMNLPQMHGRDVLDAIKSDPKIRHIPVVMLSSSRAGQDVVGSYNLHANGYVVKPISLENFSEAVHKLEQFWFTLVVLPDEEDAQQWHS